MKTYSRLLLPSALLLTACGEGPAVNPPTQPAQTSAATEAAAQAAPSTSLAPMLPGAGPTSFVGLWAAKAAWCAAPQGANRPVDISPTRFEGYENSCAITAVHEDDTGYDATLACQSEGRAATERVRMSVAGQTLTLTYRDRGNQSVRLLKCTALTDTTIRAPALPVS
jgi:hypothetical protein